MNLAWVVWTCGKVHMAKAKPESKAECIRLRVEKRMSLKEIHDQTGASKGSLSKWLANHPLTDEEIAERRSRPRGPSPIAKDRGVESRLHQIVRQRKLASVQVAKVAEAAVLLQLLAQGFNPFGSVFDGDRTDWLVEAGPRIWRIQVKTATQGQQGLPYVALTYGHGRNRRRYVEGEFDFLVGYDLFTDTCYVWSWDEVAHLSTAVSVCPEAAERWDKLQDDP